MSIVELPAVNTPQFEWARTHMAHQPRPVPPVVDPEVIADAVFRTAQNPRRELWIGWSTMKVVLGNFFLPAFLDRYLARKAFQAQETPERVQRERKDNLFEPVHGLHRTRGRFSREARNAALVVSGPVARVSSAAAGVLALVAVALFAGLSHRQPRRH